MHDSQVEERAFRQRLPLNAGFGSIGGPDYDCGSGGDGQPRRTGFPAGTLSPVRQGRQSGEFLFMRGTVALPDSEESAGSAALS